ncbi:putative NAD(P)/FAD-binding protein YdhS [Leucobacter exalbidus]|uniref:NAD(P)/FAD-binding protein YdhS n=1 Tax=Leucobacter exalbidus TaxID=662960 RepID=A0A940T6J1_9MICO|nr:putative NAD(P)/FAD-binding protein YdhS [Leucobacter exalbidus]
MSTAPVTPVTPAPQGAPAPAGIVIIGAGPAAVMLLERILANHARDTPSQRLDIQLVDPHEPGGGRIWRRAQSPLLKLNSMFADVAFFTDPSCQIAGPVAQGPTLSHWVELVRAGDIDLPEWADERIFTEVATAGPQDFPTRRLNNAYLGWAYEEALRRAAPSVTVEWVQDLAVSVNAGGHTPGDLHTVRLASGAELCADAVVYALGHNGSMPTNEAIKLSSFADRHNLGYVAPGFTADLNLDWVPAGEPVIVRGMGLAAVDLTVLLTEGRGGTFARTPQGTLAYTPSGQEPILHLGSRRGVPYRSKITSTPVGEPVALEYLGAEFHAWVRDLGRPLDFAADVWPRIVADLLTGYYRELFTGHPDRVTGTWDDFAAGLREILGTPAGYESADLITLITAHVPHADDRFDLASFDMPLAGPGVSVPSEAAPAASTAGATAPDLSPTDRVQQRVREHIAQDLRQRTSPEHSATQALFLTALFAHMALAEVPVEKWNATSRTQALPKRWQGFFSYLASGPPGHRLEELLALAEAGVVHFLGGSVQLELHDGDAAALDLAGRPIDGGWGSGQFIGSGSANIAGEIAQTRVVANTLIDAWLPSAEAAGSDNVLLRQLIRSGQASELRVADATYSGTTGQVEVADHGVIPGAERQFALGSFTSDMNAGAFARPGLNSLPFRQHDRLARQVLDAVSSVGVGSDAHALPGSSPVASRQLVSAARRRDTIGE